MDAQTIRKKYIEFFKAKKHAVIPRALLVPQDDPTTLFTGSGMQPLIPYLVGEEHPDGKRLVNSQTCFRAEDMDEVGDNRHTTFFEMLGNWSLGDYYKSNQIEWLWQFLTNEVGLDPNKLYVTVFAGDKKHGLPKDEESAEIWVGLFNKAGIKAETAEIGSEQDGYKRGIKENERIFYYDAGKNWWSRVGIPDNMPAGEPGGPDSEVFYDFGTEHNEEYGKNCHPNCECGRFLEIGNSVFMAYKKTAKGFEKLAKPNVDFGGGLERIAAASINSPDVFKISLLWPIVQELEKLSGKTYDSHTTAMRVIADHLRGAVFLAVDGVVPSNKEQGYVMRRLIRRAIRYAFELGIEQRFCEDLTPTIVDLYKPDFPEVAKAEKQVIDTLAREEKLFSQTLRKGLREFEKLAKEGLSGKQIFQLYDTYGFPAELSIEEAYKRDIDFPKDWQKDFDAEMKQQRERSQTAGKGVFKGGLADHSEETKKLHTATHLMYEALRRVLGDHVIQRGSNVNAERTRFDFSHPQKMTDEEKKKVEDIVNEQIKADLKVVHEEHSPEEAFKYGAKGAFGDKYGDRVKVYAMFKEGEKPFSLEICGGPHVEHTSQLSDGGKKFKIIKEEASSAGVRRIKAVLA